MKQTLKTEGGIRRGAYCALIVLVAAGCGGLDERKNSKNGSAHYALEGVSLAISTIYENCRGEQWLGAVVGSTVTTPNGSVQKFENGIIFNGKTHRGCLRGSFPMVDGRLLENPDSLSVTDLKSYVDDDPVLARYRKCVVKTLVDQREHRDDCSYANIHPYCGGSDTAWCSEFASWIYLHSGMQNIEGPYRHMSSVTNGPQLKNVFDEYWIDREDVTGLTAAPGDVIVMENSEGYSHTTMLVAVREDREHFFTIGGNESNTVGGPTARDYFTPGLWSSLDGIGKIQSSWFDYRNAYLPECQGPQAAFTLAPKDYRNHEEQELKGRNTYCGTLMAHGENIAGNCSFASVDVIHESVVKKSLALHELESVALDMVASGSNAVNLQATCGTSVQNKTYYRDTAAPTFREIRAFMGTGKRIIFEPVGLSDDGYWYSSNYQTSVQLDGGAEIVLTGNIGRLDNLSNGEHTEGLRITDGCGRVSTRRTIRITTNNGYLVDPNAPPQPAECPQGQVKNALGICVVNTCDGANGWIFSPEGAGGNGSCECAPPGHPLYNPTHCIY